MNFQHNTLRKIVIELRRATNELEYDFDMVMVNQLNEL